MRWFVYFELGRRDMLRPFHGATSNIKLNICLMDFGREKKIFFFQQRTNLSSPFNQFWVKLNKTIQILVVDIQIITFQRQVCTLLKTFVIQLLLLISHLNSDRSIMKLASTSGLQYMYYSNLEEQDSVWEKIKRSSYLIVSISLLTHTISIVYSLMTFKQQSAGFISIIVSSLVCFFISSSHLTIYGISILGSLYIAMLLPYYNRYQIYYVVAMSGIIMFAFWRTIHTIGVIFHCLPGRIHASMVFGIVLIVLSKFFPLAIENVIAFFDMASESALSSPFEMLKEIFAQFNVLTLVLTIVSICLLFLLRGRLERIPLIGILVIIGIIANWNHLFKSYIDLCNEKGVNCKFYIINPDNIKIPVLNEIIEVIPAAFIMTIILIFEQFLYLEEFQRRGKRFSRNAGNLGQVTTQSKTLALANLISGCLGGLPICINMFATYQNFAFNQKYGFRGTKWVGLLQVPFSYLLYSILSLLFNMIPLFVLFAVVATPMIYFIKNVLNFHSKNIVLIICIGALNVLTHPLFALIFAALVSIYDIAQLLRPASAEMILQTINQQKQRRSSTLANVAFKQPHKDNKLISQFVSRVIEIQDDIPDQLEDKQYVIYRLVGSVSFLNYFQHIQELNKVISQYCRNDACILIISFRYSRMIDDESLEELAIVTENLKKDGIRIIFTGLHLHMMEKMEHIPYFSQLLQDEQKCMYSLHAS